VGADPSIVAALFGAGLMPDLLTVVNMARNNRQCMVSPVGKQAARIFQQIYSITCTDIRRER